MSYANNYTNVLLCFRISFNFLKTDPPVELPTVAVVKNDLNS